MSGIVYLRDSDGPVLKLRKAVEGQNLQPLIKMGDADLHQHDRLGDSDGDQGLLPLNKRGDAELNLPGYTLWQTGSA